MLGKTAGIASVFIKQIECVKPACGGAGVLWSCLALPGFEHVAALEPKLDTIFNTYVEYV